MGIIYLLCFIMCLGICYLTKNVFLLVAYVLFLLYLLKIYQLIFIKIIDTINLFKSIKSGKYFKRLYGVYGVVGEYGQGKTIYMAYQYAQLKIKKFFHNPADYIFISNFNLKGTLPFCDLNDVINYYRQCVFDNKGLVVFWDEIQNHFPENDRSFPQELRVLLTQNRKNKGIRLIWSTQDYTRVNKNIRLMSTKITEMKCYFRRYMRAKHYSRAVYEDFYNTVEIDKKIKKRARTSTIFIQTDKIRNMFDSFKMLDIAKEKLGL